MVSMVSCCRPSSEPRSLIASVVASPWSMKLSEVDIARIIGKIDIIE